MAFFVRASRSLEVELVRLKFNLWVFAVFQADGEEDERVALGPHHRGWSKSESTEKSATVVDRQVFIPGQRYIRLVLAFFCLNLLKMQIKKGF